MNVQFTLNKTEYDQLAALAKDKGISIPKYVKDCVLPPNPEGYFQEVWKELIGKIERFPAGIEFTIATVMTGDRWQSFSRSTKLSLAKQLNKKVAAGDIPGVYLKSKSSANVSIYEKHK